VGKNPVAFAADKYGPSLGMIITGQGGQYVSRKFRLRKDFKPFSKKNPDAYLGDDELNWKEIMTTAESVGGIEWYIIEYEREAVPPLESLGANLTKFKAMRV
jgi:hypothetical protein